MPSKNFQRKFRAAVFVVLFLFVFMPATVIAQSQNNRSSVVLTLDTSGSMKKNDPGNLRIEAAALFVRLLKEDYKVALVTFDQSISVRVPLSSLSKGKRYLQKQLKYVGSSGPYTDIYHAIEVGYLLLSREKESAEKSIILMSDGMLDLGDPEKDRRMKERLFNVLIPDMETQGVKVYTIAFTETSDSELLREIAERTGGQFYLVKGASDIHRAFTDIFTDLEGPDSLPIRNKTFRVDRSVKEINIIVTKQKSRKAVVLMGPDKKRYSYKKHPPYMRWYNAKVFEMITIREPRNGQWRILYNADEGNSVFILTDLKLVSTALRNTLPVGSKQIVEVWLEDKGERLDSIPLLLKNVVFEGMLLDSSNNGKEISLNDEGLEGDKIANDGVYTGVLHLTEEGIFTLRLRAIGKTFERERIKTFSVRKINQKKDQHEEAVKKEISIEEKQKVTSAAESVSKKEVLNNEEVEQFSWTGIVIKFILVNLLLGAIGGGIFLYKKKKRASSEDDDVTEEEREDDEPEIIDEDGDDSSEKQPEESDSSEEKKDKTAEDVGTDKEKVQDKEHDVTDNTDAESESAEPDDKNKSKENNSEEEERDDQD